MGLRRRFILTAAPAMLLAAGSLTQAAADTTDLAVTCDTAAAPAVSQVAMAYTARTGIRIRVHPTSPGLVLPQLQRDIQNDILVTQTTRLDQAEALGLVAPGGRSGAWRNRLVVAITTATGGPAGSFAVPDATAGSDIDGPAIMRNLKLTPTVGVLDTNAVAWMLVQGEAQRGLLHMTEVAADHRLRAETAVPDAAWPPIVYAATVTRLASRLNPQAFVAFLGSEDGLAALRAAALEQVS